MKKTNKVKMGPLGTPLGNPLGYFNSLKGKNKVEPKQTFKFGGLRKKDCGGDTGIPCPEETAVTPEGKPLGANVGIGNFSAGYSGRVSPTALTDSKVNAGYTNANTGFGARGAYDFNNKSVDAGVTYNNNGFGIDAGYNNETGFKGGVGYTGTVKGTPIKFGLTYNNQKGGIVKSIKKIIKKITKPTGPKMQKGGLIKKKK
jgi:hypothetical protein